MAKYFLEYGEDEGRETEREGWREEEGEWEVGREGEGEREMGREGEREGEGEGEREMEGEGEREGRCGVNRLYIKDESVDFNIDYTL